MGRFVADTGLARATLISLRAMPANCKRRKMCHVDVFKRRRISKAVDEWLGSVWQDSLMVLILNGLRGQQLQFSEDLDYVVTDKFWQSLTNVPRDADLGSDKGLMGEYQQAVEWCLKDRSSYKFFRAVTLAVGYLRRLCWDIAADPMDAE